MALLLCKMEPCKTVILKMIFKCDISFFWKVEFLSVTNTNFKISEWNVWHGLISNINFM